MTEYQAAEERYETTVVLLTPEGVFPQLAVVIPNNSLAIRREANDHFQFLCNPPWAPRTLADAGLDPDLYRLAREMPVEYHRTVRCSYWCL